MTPIIHYDQLTREWYYKGKWYDHYPKEEIEYQMYLEDERGDYLYNLRKDEKACMTTKK